MSRRTDYALNLKKKKHGLEIKSNMDLIEDSEVEYVIYARKSTDDDINQRQSIPDQIKACIYYVEKNKERGGKNITIMKKNDLFEKYFKDELADIKEERNLDISDKRFYNEVDDLFIIRESASAKNPGRPKRDALIKLVNDGKIKGILSYSPDRQARNMIDGGVLIELATVGKVKLVYTNFLFENSPSGRMMLGIWFVYSKFYSDNLSHITTRGNKSATEKGKALGNYKHGYDINEHREYVPNERFPTIRQAFELRLYTDASNQKIADMLKASGYCRETKGSKKTIYYNGGEIGNWRTDPFYYGLLVHSSMETELGNHYDFVPMITPDEHNILCEKYLNDRRGVKMVKDGTELQYILDPFEKQSIKNQRGKSMTMYVSKKSQMENRFEKLEKSGKKFRYIDKIAKSYLRYKSSDGKFEVTYKEMEPQIIKWLKGINITETMFEKFKRHISKGFEEKNQKILEQRKVFERQRDRLKDEKRRYVADALQNRMDEEEQGIYNERKARFDEDIKKVQQFLDELILEEQTRSIEFESFFQVLSNAAKYYELGDIVRRRKIVSILTSNLVINDDKSLNIRVKPGLEILFKGMVGDEGFEPTTPSV